MKGFKKQNKVLEFAAWVLVPLALFVFAFLYWKGENPEMWANANNPTNDILLKLALFQLAVLPSLNIAAIFRNEGYGSKWLTFLSWIIAFIIFGGVITDWGEWY